MRNIVILLNVIILFSCGPSDEEVNAKKEQEAKSHLDKGIKYFQDKDFNSAKFTLKQGIDYYPTTNSAKEAQALIDSIKNVEKSIFADPKTYEIITTDNRAQCKNYHILLKFKDHSLKNIDAFVTGFIAEYVGKGKICTITMYRSKSSSNLMIKYPLSKSEYKQLAKQTIAVWDFDTKEVQMNPYKDAFNQ